MRTSTEGSRLITQREGKILHVYKDSKGLPTAGVGHLLVGAEKRQFPVGTPITQKQCDEWLAADLGECEDVVNGLGVDLSQNEFDALTSLAFNIGVGNRRTGKGGFIGSTIVRRLKAGDHKAAAEAILLWAKPPEIQGRRRGEYHQFKTPYKGTYSVAGEQGSIVKAIDEQLQEQTDQQDAGGSSQGHSQEAEPPPVTTTVEKKTVEDDGASRTVTTETQTPTVNVTKEGPSTFVKIGAAVTAAIGFITNVGINIGTLFDRATEGITGKQVAGLVAGAGLVALAIWLYDRSAQRANALNRAKIAAAADRGLNTVELKG